MVVPTATNVTECDLRSARWRRAVKCLLVVYWLAAACVTHLPPPPEPKATWPHQDKLWHFGGYLVLGLLVGLAVRRSGPIPGTAAELPAPTQPAADDEAADGEREGQRSQRVASIPKGEPAAFAEDRTRVEDEGAAGTPQPCQLAPQHWQRLLMIVGVYAALDELTQPLVARDAEVLDWCADMVGTAAGLLVAAWLAQRVAFAAKPLGAAGHAWGETMGP